MYNNCPSNKQQTPDIKLNNTFACITNRQYCSYAIICSPTTQLLSSQNASFTGQMLWFTWDFCFFLGIGSARKSPLVEVGTVALSSGHVKCRLQRIKSDVEYRVAGWSPWRVLQIALLKAPPATQSKKLTACKPATITASSRSFPGKPCCNGDINLYFYFNTINES